MEYQGALSSWQGTCLTARPCSEAYGDKALWPPMPSEKQRQPTMLVTGPPRLVPCGGRVRSSGADDEEEVI